MLVFVFNCFDDVRREHINCLKCMQKTATYLNLAGGARCPSTYHRNLSIYQHDLFVGIISVEIPISFGSVSLYLLIMYNKLQCNSGPEKPIKKYNIFEDKYNCLLENNNTHIRTYILSIISHKPIVSYFIPIYKCNLFLVQK